MEAPKACCQPNQTMTIGKSRCKCAPGWTCVIRKVEGPETDGKPFTNCTESCVCVPGDGSKRVETEEGGYCICEKGHACTFTRTEGPDAGKVFFECGNGCKCELSSSGNEVVVINT